MINTELELFELKTLIEAVKLVYNLDFSHYREAYIERRVKRRIMLDGLSTITALTNEIILQSDYAKKFIEDVSINVTEMYRCPTFFKTLKEEVFPILNTYPSIKIWHAGCATGEEVLSLAILLKEAGLAHKTKVIATDISDKALAIAKAGEYPAAKIKNWTKHYTEAGGNSSFADYYEVKFNVVSFSKDLLENVEFKNHDLSKHTYPKDCHLIICRNVFIYFDETLQSHCINNYHDSLVSRGFLGLGRKETIKKSNRYLFEELSHEYKIYRKKVDG